MATCRVCTRYVYIQYINTVYILYILYIRLARGRNVNTLCALCQLSYYCSDYAISPIILFDITLNN